MVDVRGDVLRPPRGTTPAAVKANKNQKPIVRRTFWWRHNYRNNVRTDGKLKFA